MILVREGKGQPSCVLHVLEKRWPRFGSGAMALKGTDSGLSLLP